MDQGFWIFLLSGYGLILAGLITGVLAHEGGHFLCARIAGLPVERVVFGFGPVVARGCIGQLAMELRRWPFAAQVQLASDAAAPKPWQALFVLGGVLGNITVMGLAWLYETGAWRQNQPGPLLPVGEVFFLTQAFFIVTSLHPFRAIYDGAPVHSDGLQLLELISPGIADVTMLSPYRRRFRLRVMPSKAFWRVREQLRRPGRDKDLDVRRDGCKALQHELAQGGLSADEEMYFLDTLVTDGLLYSDPALRANLDAWSLRAVQLGPKVSTLRGSRGCVLVEIGRYAEGKKILEPIVSAKSTPPIDGLIDRTFLARAEYALGDEVAARRLMAEARDMAATAGGSDVTALIARIENEMQARPSGVVLVHQHVHSLNGIAQ